MRIALNGFGRIGRALLRIIVQRDLPVEVVAINDVADPNTLAALLQRDSVYGAFEYEATWDGQHLVVGERRIQMLQEADPEALPWRALEIDVVLEATGRHTTQDAAEAHRRAGATRVLITAPSADVDTTVVLGINSDALTAGPAPGVVSLASCTTNALAPLVYLLEHEYGVEHAFMSTVHAVTQDQRILDAPHKDPRRARSAIGNIIPTTTGASRTVAKVVPEVVGKVWGHAIRVPVPVGSIVELHAVLGRDTTCEEVLSLFHRAAEGRFAGILEVSHAPLVSSDIVANSATSILDAELTQVQGRYASVYAWYDNEWGFSNRVIDAVELLMR